MGKEEGLYWPPSQFGPSKDGKFGKEKGKVEEEEEEGKEEIGARFGIIRNS